MPGVDLPAAVAAFAAVVAGFPTVPGTLLPLPPPVEGSRPPVPVVPAVPKPDGLYPAVEVFAPDRPELNPGRLVEAPVFASGRFRLDGEVEAPVLDAGLVGPEAPVR